MRNYMFFYVAGYNAATLPLVVCLIKRYLNET